MKYRPFGKTGLEVSELVVGGGYVGGILLHAETATKQRLIERMHEGGINWLDTAANYGDGNSERVIGELLRDIPMAARPTISTKFSLDTAKLDDIPGQIERSLTDSLGRLQIDRVTLLQLHNPLNADGFSLDHVLAPGGVCDAMERLREQGLFDHSGFTALGDPGQCIQLIDSGRMQSAQVYFNMLNPSAGHQVPAGWSSANFAGLIDHCESHGVAVMNIRTFAAGVLASPVSHGREVPITPNAEVAQEQARAEKVYAALGEAYGDRAQTALRFSLSRPGISCVVIGLAELEHLETALEAAALGPLPETAIAQLAELWAEDFAD